MAIGPYSHDEFMEEARKFHGYPAPGLIIAGYMVEMARAALPEGTLFDVISETGQCLPDAVQMLTPCTIGNGWLRIHPFGLYAASFFDKFNGQGVRVHLDPNKLTDYPEIRSWFFKEKPKKEQDTERLQAEIKAAGQKILSLRPVQVLPQALGHKGKGRVVPCPLCHEWYPASLGGICPSCQGGSPYAPTASADAIVSAAPLKAVPVEESLGQHALHDMTQITKDDGGDRSKDSKQAAFKAGQYLDVGDVCRLQQMGRSNIYTLENNAELEDWVHEDSAVQKFAEYLPGTGVGAEGEPAEGKINFQATQAGLLRVDVDRLERFNLVPDVMCSTRRHNSVVRKGERIAGSRAIPLYLAKHNFIKALAVLEEGALFNVVPMRKAKAGLLITGTEVFSGIIQDKFSPILTKKLQALDCSVVLEKIVPDDALAISQAVQEMLAAGADLIVTTAGMSVDPDDVTRKGLLDAGLCDTLYGLPMLPGTMTLVGKIGTAQVLGVPACALYFKTTAIDVLLPQLLANVDITRLDLARLGHGGLCMECKSCIYPHCSFGV